MFEHLKEFLGTIAIVLSGLAAYIALREKATVAELRNQYSNDMSQRTAKLYEKIEIEIEKIEATIKATAELKYNHLEQVQRQTNEIENFVMAEIKVLKTQIAERDIRLDKFEKKIDELNSRMQDNFNHLNERIMDIRELIIGMASK